MISLILPRDVAEERAAKLRKEAREKELMQAAANAVATRMHFNEADGSFAIERIQDVEPILELNKARQAQGWDGYNASGDFRTDYELPLVVAEKLRNERGLDALNKNHDEAIHRLIMTDPDYKYLRAHAKTHANIRIKGAR